MGPKKQGRGRGSAGTPNPRSSNNERDNVAPPAGPPQRIVVGPSVSQAPFSGPRPSNPLPQTPRPYTPSLVPHFAAQSQQGGPPVRPAYTPPLLPILTSYQLQGPPPPRPTVSPSPVYGLPGQAFTQAARPAAGVRPPPGYGAPQAQGRGMRPPVRTPQGYNPLTAPRSTAAAPRRPPSPKSSKSSTSSVAQSLPKESTIAPGMQQLDIQDRPASGLSESSTAPRTTVQPTTGRELDLALRPGFGTLGRPIRLKANFFQAACSKDTLFHYDVVIKPETTSRGVRRAVINELVRSHKSTTLMNILPVYDGSKSLYTARPLPFHSRDFIDVIPADEVPSAPAPAGQPAREPRKYKVTLSIVANVDMYPLREFLAGRTLELPQTAIQALDIVLREKALQSNVPVGRSFFNERVAPPADLSGGLVAWRGYYQSLRPTQGGLSLNLDMSASAFHKPIEVVDYITEVVRNWRGGTLGDSERIKLAKALTGVRFEVTHQGNKRRRYRIMGITRKPAKDLRFEYQGQEVSIVEYFEQAHGYKLRYPGLQCFEVGARKDVLLPMEVCRIIGGQRYPRKLSDQQVRYLLDIVKQRPGERKRLTTEMVARNAYSRDEYAQEFGLTISNEMADVPGRILNPPTLVYKEQNQKDKLQQPRDGAWNLIRTRLYSGATIERWAVLAFVQQRATPAVAKFAATLAAQCNEMGMTMNRQPMLPVADWVVGDETFYNSASMVAALKAVASQAHRSHPQGLQLLICVFPELKSQPYGTLKRVCETEIGIVTQCCQFRHVQANKPQYIANLALKINVKVQPAQGARPAYNTLLSKELQNKLPFINEDKIPTIIFGADVTHPQPGEREEGASIAAIVASQDWPYVNRYEALVSAQAGTEEIIQNAQGMYRAHLISFYNRTGQKPQRIIMYRDGVSEGQFYQVLWHELNALWRCCKLLEPNGDYMPKVTWIVCQKRHHTRLYCADDRQADRSGNVPAGTVVDRVITHPTQFDFYLNSHAGLLGTSRPCHYHVLYDQNGFTADAIQDLTNSLCYTYARCTRSVSLAPPAYYAHLAAFRARFYMDSAENDRGSASSGSSGRREAGRPKHHLPEVKPALHGTMFFC